MIVEFFKSLIENIKNRIKNPFSERNTTPFGGAYLIALIIYNWKLIFSFLFFDQNETRLSKIEIISKYIEQQAWYCRIGNPLWIAFLMILFYYVFNNISLGITTFFNRWFRATVLYFTERSRLITREEHEKSFEKFDKLKMEYEALKRVSNETVLEIMDAKKEVKEKEELLNKAEIDKGYADSEHNKTLAQKIAVDDENKKLLSQIIVAKEELNKQLLLSEKTINDNENLIEKINSIEEDQKKYRILYARYGKGLNFNDVTKIVTDLAAKHTTFQVVNELLQGDPVRYTVKELFIVYEHNKQVHQLLANEYDKIEVKDNLLVATKTEKSKQYPPGYETSKIRNLGDIFIGKWKNSFKINNKIGVEIFEIKEGNKYFINGEHFFDIEDFIWDESKSELSFTKIAVKEGDKRHVPNKLVKTNEKLFTGFENTIIPVEYSKEA